jgi:6-phosphofructokinase 1
VGERPRGDRRPRRLARDGRPALPAARPGADLGSCRAACTIIGTTRTNPYKVEGGIDGVKRSFEQLDALVAIGGEDTLGVAARIYKEFAAPVVGVPKTIDNDLNGTDYTFGFDTAVAICTEAIDRLPRPPSRTQPRDGGRGDGRHTGWIAVMSGIAGGADMILIPERPIDLDEVRTESSAGTGAAELLDRRRQRRAASCPAPRTGQVDQFGHKLLAKRGVGERLGDEIQQRTGFETRVTVLGHVQRGGSPPRETASSRRGLV